MDTLLIQSLNTSSNITYENVYNKIILTFPIYYKIFNKYYSEGKDVSYEGIQNIIIDIKNKYNPDKSYAIIDYIEYLFGNILYETFLFEIKKINPDNIRYEYLCVFEYIIGVECIKYYQYFQIISKLKQTEPESKLILAMENRIEGCCKKMSFCLSWLKRNYQTQTYILELCNQIIEKNDIKSKINIESVNTINSFMDLGNKKNK